MLESGIYLGERLVKGVQPLSLTSQELIHGRFYLARKRGMV